MINFLNNSTFVISSDKNLLLGYNDKLQVKNIFLSEDLLTKIYKILTGFEFNLALSINNKYIKRVFIIGDVTNTTEKFTTVFIFVKDGKNVTISFTYNNTNIKIGKSEIDKFKRILKIMKYEPDATYGKYSLIKEAFTFPTIIGAGEVHYFHQEKKAFINNKGKIEEFNFIEKVEPEPEPPVQQEVVQEEPVKQEIPPEAVAYSLQQEGVTVEKFNAPELYKLDALPEIVPNINGGLYYYNDKLHDNDENGILTRNSSVEVVYKDIPHNFNYPKDTLVYEEQTKQIFLYTAENNKLELLTSNVTKNNKPTKNGAYIMGGKFVRVYEGKISDFPGLEGMSLPIQYSKQYLHTVNHEYYVRGTAATSIILPKKGLVNNRDVFVTNGAPAFAYCNGDKVLVKDKVYQYQYTENKWITIN